MIKPEGCKDGDEQPEKELSGTREFKILAVSGTNSVCNSCVTERKVQFKDHRVEGRNSRSE
jgi:hypothetical protein